MAYAGTHTTVQHDNAALQGIPARLVALVANAVDRFHKARAFRKTMHELQALPNAQLCDMGLNRSMIRRVAYQAVYTD